MSLLSLLLLMSLARLRCQIPPPFQSAATAFLPSLLEGVGAGPLPVHPPSFLVLAAFFFILHFSCFTLFLTSSTLRGMPQTLLTISAILFHARFIIWLVRSLDGVVDDETKTPIFTPVTDVTSPPSLPDTASIPINCKSFSSQSFRGGGGGHLSQFLLPSFSWQLSSFLCTSLASLCFRHPHHVVCHTLLTISVTRFHGTCYWCF